MGGTAQKRDCFTHLEQRRSMMAALISLASDRPVSKVKVADLCARCGISRTAFYRLFPGVDGIVSWYRDYGAELGMLQIGRTLTVEEGHRVSLELIARAQPLFRGYVHCWKQEFSYPAVNAQVKSMEMILGERGIKVAPGRHYALEGVAYASHLTVSSWVNRGIDVSPAELATELASLYPSWLRELLDNPFDRSSIGSLVAELFGRTV